MILSKRKRKLNFRGKNYYWYIKENNDDILRIHIISEDKLLRLEYGFDKEIGIGTHYIINLLSTYLEKG